MLKRLFNRLMNVFKANANDAIDQIEDPVKMIKLAIAEMEISIQKSTEALAQAMANQKSLERKLGEFTTQSQDWYNKATLAIKNNDEALGKKALEKKSIVDKQVLQYTELNNQSVSMVEKLRSQLDRMKVKFDEAKAKESILIAKAQTAKAQTEIAEKLGGISSSGMADFERFEEKINKLGDVAGAKVELVEATSRIDREFELLESEAKVYTDFDEIKQKLAEEEKKKLLLEEEKKIKMLETRFKNDPKALEEQKAKLLNNSSQLKTPQDIFDELNKPNEDKINDFFKNK